MIKKTKSFKLCIVNHLDELDLRVRANQLIDYHWLVDEEPLAYALIVPAYDESEREDIKIVIS